MKILVVDDSKTMLLFTRKHLRSIGFEDDDILTTDSGRQALDIVQFSPISMVLLDWHIPDLSGIKVLKVIKSYKSRKIPVIMVSTEQEKKYVMQAIDSGADDYILKPVTPEKLVNKISRNGLKYNLELPELKLTVEPEKEDKSKDIEIIVIEPLDFESGKPD